MVQELKFTALFALCMLIPNPVFSAPTYRCVDNNKNISYSSVPCETKGKSTAAIVDFSPKTPLTVEDNSQAIKTCKAIVKELREIKMFRDRNLDTGGPKSLLEIERDWQRKYDVNSCSRYHSTVEKELLGNY